MCVRAEPVEVVEVFGEERRVAAKGGGVVARRVEVEPEPGTRRHVLGEQGGIGPLMDLGAARIPEPDGARGRVGIDVYPGVDRRVDTALAGIHRTVVVAARHQSERDAPVNHPSPHPSA